MTRLLTPALLLVATPCAAALAQDAYLKAQTAEDNAILGEAVGCQGEFAIAASQTRGPAGTVTVFRRTGSGWIHFVELGPPGATSSEQFGDDVAIDGDTMVVGAPADSSGTGQGSSSGAAYVFVFDGVAWSFQQKLKAPAPVQAALFGAAVDVSGDRLVVGAPGEAGAAGRAYVYDRSGSTWSHAASLVASNTDAGDFYGYSVAVLGDEVLIGAPFEASDARGIDGSGANNNAPLSGAAYLYRRAGGAWPEAHYVKSSNADIGDSFGWDVDASGGTFVVGAHFEGSAATMVNGNQNDNSFAGAGAVYTFLSNGTTLTQEAYIKPSNTGFADQFGFAVAIEGERLAVGAPTEESGATGVNGNQLDNSVSQAGAAYTFHRVAGLWTQVDYLKGAAPDAQDVFGFAVGVAGTTTVVGMLGDDSNATGVNGDPTDNSGDDVGAAFVFEGSFVARFCQANPNASGQAAVIDAIGDPSVAANDLRLEAYDLPANSFSFFLTSMDRGFVANPAGSAGNLCLGGSIGRFVGPGQVQFSGASGTIALQLDLTTIPQPTQIVAIQAGESWAFTAWFRDVAGGVPTSNFTDGVEVAFVP